MVHAPFRAPSMLVAVALAACSAPPAEVPVAPTPAPAPVASAPASAALVEPAAPTPAPAPEPQGGIREVTGIQVVGKAIEVVGAAEVGAALEAAGYQVKIDPEKTCGDQSEMRLGAKGESGPVMVAFWRKMEKKADDCFPSDVKDMVDAWRNSTEGENATSVMVVDEQGGALFMVTSFGGGQAEAAKVVDLLVKPGA